MEIRKIQRTGGSSHIVSLPKQWANRIGVTNGMNVGITTRPDGTLLITPDISSPFPALKLMDVTGKLHEVLVQDRMKDKVHNTLRAIDHVLTYLDAKNVLHLRIISDSIDRIGDYGANIAEIAINSTISKSV